MDRRKYLTLLGTGSLATVAGCLGDDDDDDPADTDDGPENGDDDDDDDDPADTDDGPENGDDPTDDPNDAPDDDPNDDTEPDDQELTSNYEVSADVPSEIEVGDEWGYSVTVSNTGEGEGEEAAEVLVEFISDDGTTDVISTEQVALEPGESETFESDRVEAEEALTGTLRFTVEGPDNSDEFETELDIEEAGSTGPEFLIETSQIRTDLNMLWETGVEATITNVGDTGNYVEVTVDWLTDDGSFLGSQPSSIVRLRPDETWRTAIPFTDDGSPNDYEIFISSLTTGAGPVLNEIVEVIESRYEDETLFIQAEAEESVSFVRVTGYGFNEQGEIVATGFTFEDLPSDRTLRTDFGLSTPFPEEEITDVEVLFLD